MLTPNDRVRRKDRAEILSMSAAHNNFFSKQQRNEILKKNAEERKNTAINNNINPMLCLSCDTSFEYSSKSESSSPARLPGQLYLFGSRFTDKFKGMYFRPKAINLSNSLENTQLISIRRLAKHVLKFYDLTVSLEAQARTKRAAKDFFVLSHRLLDGLGREFPLAGKNKCLGMAVVKGNNSVFIAISQDENAENDLELRENFVDFVRQLNAMAGNRWRFELVHTPTEMEYFLPRTLNLDTSRPAATYEIEPRMRCVEIHLMVALNKAGRTIRFNPEDVAMVAFSGTLWASETESIAAASFGSVKRNGKYLSERPLSVTLYNNEKAYIDVWAPCKEHCSIYYNEMLAIINAKEHFYGPRAEQNREDMHRTPNFTGI